MKLKERMKRLMGYSKDRYSTSEQLVYIAAWGIMFLFPVVEDLFTLQSAGTIGTYWRVIFNQWLLYVPFLLLFVVHNRIIFPWLCLRQRMAAYIACVVVLTLLVMGAVSLYDSLWPRRWGVMPSAPQEQWEEAPKRMDEGSGNLPGGQKRIEPWQQQHGWAPPMAGNRPGPYPLPGMETRRLTPAQFFLHGPFIMRVLIALLMLSFNIAVKFYFKSLRDKAAMWKLKLNNTQTELDYLKYQINPHFFMNTLNNIHALVDIDAEKAQRMIVEFSNLMRYLLYETNSSLILLSKELQFLRNYVELMRIRFTENVHINLSLPDDAGDVQVPPLLFISFVENAFKHGTSRQEEPQIDVGLQVRDDKVCFKCANSNFGQCADQYHGIGLENIRKRLQLIYGERYTLDIEETEKTFTVTLTVPVSRKKKEMTAATETDLRS